MVRRILRTYLSDENIYPIARLVHLIQQQYKAIGTFTPYPHDTRGPLSSLMMSLVHNLLVSDKVTGIFTWFWPEHWQGRVVGPEPSGVRLQIGSSG